MELPLSLKGFIAMRVGIGLSAIAAPSGLAHLFGLPPADAKTPMATMGSAFFGIRELVLAAIAAGATAAEPQARRRVLLACAATDGLDLAVLGARAVRQPALRRGVAMFAPGAIASVVLHVRAARKVVVLP